MQTGKNAENNTILFFVLRELQNFIFLQSENVQGSLAEWLGSGLQNRVRRFDSARNLNLKESNNGSLFLYGIKFYYHMLFFLFAYL